MNNNKIINPYSFIPLSGKKTIGRPGENENTKYYTGCIEYSLLTKTSIFIPNSSNDDAFELKKYCPDHKSYNFFSYDVLNNDTKADYYEPVIPGSEMRGLIRSNYEIITNSCMSGLEKETKVKVKDHNSGFRKKIEKALDIKRYEPCEENMCPACLLFGTINGKNAITSQLRFSDMKFEYKTNTNLKDIYEGENGVALKILSSPKKYEAFYVDEDNVIKGRKFYWHDLNADYKLIESKEHFVRTGQNVSVRPLKKDNYFKGKVYFEKLTKEELDYLIYVLECGEEKDIAINKRKHGYKLGMGKSIGLGSVVLKIDCVKLRQIDMSDVQDGYKIVESEYNYGDLKANIDETTKKHFEKMTDFYAIGDSGHIGYVDVRWYNRNNSKQGYKNTLETMKPFEFVDNTKARGNNSNKGKKQWNQNKKTNSREKNN